MTDEQIKPSPSAMQQDAKYWQARAERAEAMLAMASKMLSDAAFTRVNPPTILLCNECPRREQLNKALEERNRRAGEKK